MGTSGMRWNFADDGSGARVDRARRRSVYWPCCCWFGSYSTSSTSWSADDDGHILSPWSWTGRSFAFMSCFKRSNGQQSPRQRRATPFSLEPFSESGGDIGRDESAGRTMQFDAKFGSEGVQFTEKTSALVRQASTVAAKAQQQRMSREKRKISAAAWTILRRGSSAECRNSAAPPTPVLGTSKQRQLSLGGSMSPKFSVDSAKKHLLHFRRQTTDASPLHQIHTRPGGGRMSIVAKDWDSVHKVHDPESAVGGVYVGDDEANGSRRSKKMTNGKVKGESQGAFTALKISESTDGKLSMIDDEISESTDGKLSLIDDEAKE